MMLNKYSDQVQVKTCQMKTSRGLIRKRREDTEKEFTSKSARRGEGEFFQTWKAENEIWAAWRSTC